MFSLLRSYDLPHKAIAFRNVSMSIMSMDIQPFSNPAIQVADNNLHLSTFIFDRSPVVTIIVSNDKKK